MLIICLIIISLAAGQLSAQQIANEQQSERLENEEGQTRTALPKKTVVVLGMTGGSQELANMLVNERADNASQPFTSCFNQNVVCDTTPGVRSALSGKYSVMLVPIQIQINASLETVTSLFKNNDLEAMLLVVLVESRVQAIPLQKLHHALFGDKRGSSRMVWVHLDVASVDHGQVQQANLPLRSVFESGPWMSLAVPNPKLFWAATLSSSASSSSSLSDIEHQRHLQSRIDLLHELKLVIDTIPLLDTDRTIRSPEEFVRLKNQVALDQAERFLPPLPDVLSDVFARCSVAHPQLSTRIQEARIQLRQCWTDDDTANLNSRQHLEPRLESSSILLASSPADRSAQFDPLQPFWLGALVFCWFSVVVPIMIWCDVLRKKAEQQVNNRQQQEEQRKRDKAHEVEGRRRQKQRLWKDREEKLETLTQQFQIRQKQAEQRRRDKAHEVEGRRHQKHRLWKDKEEKLIETLTQQFENRQQQEEQRRRDKKHEVEGRRSQKQQLWRDREEKLESLAQARIQDKEEQKALFTELESFMKEQIQAFQHSGSQACGSNNPPVSPTPNERGFDGSGTPCPTSKSKKSQPKRTKGSRT